MNPINPHPEITELIKEDIQRVSDTQVHSLRLIRAKQGVYVYRCLYGETPAVVKYFENADDRRELRNYRILARHGIPTLKTFALGEATLVMEDVSLSEHLRLGAPEDLDNAGVAKSLCHWYFALHENGSDACELDSLYFEHDRITSESLEALMLKLPEATALFQFLLAHYDSLRALIYRPAFTLTYNDFYWTNLVVRKDGRAAMMFDYNLLGRGYRHSDLRNVCSSMSATAGKAFTDEYERLYAEKHGHDRLKEAQTEERIDGLAGPLFSLIIAFFERDAFPDWANYAKDEAINGTLLSKAERLLLLP